LHCWEQQRDEHADDRNDHQQLDEGKTPFFHGTILTKKIKMKAKPHKTAARMPRKSRLH
jgi:hypothetical protein